MNTRAPNTLVQLALLCLLSALQSVHAQTARTMLYGKPDLQDTAPPLAAAGFSRTNAPQSAPLIMSEAGPNHRVWGRGLAQPANPHEALGKPWRHNGAEGVLEIASGLNYFDGQQFRLSEPVFEPAPDGNGFIAERVQHRIRVQGDLNTQAAISVSHGTNLLRSTPLAIMLYDAASGKTAIISVVSNTQPFLVPGAQNQIVYPDAFPGLADFVVTLERGSFEADVVFTANPDPARWNFPTNTTRIQVVTEYFNPPIPEVDRTVIYSETNAVIRSRMASPDLVNEDLTFGGLSIAAGRAFTRDTDPALNRGGIPVAKEFVTYPETGRTFLIESIAYRVAREALSALPQAHASAEPPSGSRKGLLASASMPRLPSAQPRSTQTQLAARPVAALHKGFVVDSLTVVSLNGTYNGTYIFKGDTTYYVSGPTYMTGPVTIEGGTVIKYPTTTAFIQLGSAVNLQTGTYRPAIFTAIDDDSVGLSLVGDPAYSGSIQSVGYADPALRLNYVYNPTLSNCRFSFCKSAVQFYQLSPITMTMNHCQLVGCIRGITVSGNPGSGSGSGSGPSQVLANNCLFAYVAYPVNYYSSIATSGTFTHCTMDNVQVLASATYGGSSWSWYNSVLANVTSASSGSLTLSGNRNGLFRSPTVGGSPITEDPNLVVSPFAPICRIDGDGTHLFTANVQGAYYLREYSPFVDQANASYDTASLKADLEQRTTAAPSEILTNDITSSQTWGQAAVRDVGTYDLGYHYPKIDYLINGVTVNNATLNIDQGVVVATVGVGSPEFLLEDPDLLDHVQAYDWGIRLNPGGRLNVNGYPTNRVTLVPLHAIQESPMGFVTPYRATIAVKNIKLAAGDPPVTPLAEVALRYADFPTLARRDDDAGGVHLGCVMIFDSRHDDSYGAFGKLTIEGCLFQGGILFFEDGGPAGRVVSVRNTIFERASFQVWYTGGYESFYGIDVSTPAQLFVSNNLFYYGDVGLYSLDAGGAQWTFTDNIFDHIIWHVLCYDPWSCWDANGPVVNHHNAYAGMAAYPFRTSRLANDPPDTVDPNSVDLATLSYATGKFGRFYLPGSATSLINHGSQLASSAGQYHFTTSASNGSKELGTQLDIGPHFVGVNSSGVPADSNAGGADGIPDFLADANGDGAEQISEVPWISSNGGAPAILTPDTSFSGIAAITVNPGVTPSGEISLIVDGTVATTARSPRGCPGFIEFDTRLLQNGVHSLSAAIEAPASSTVIQDGVVVYLPSINITTANSIRFPSWNDRTELTVAVKASVPDTSQHFASYFFGGDYPKSYAPVALGTLDGDVEQGSVQLFAAPVDCGLNDPLSDPVVFAFVRLSDQDGATTALQVAPPSTRSNVYPPIGYWVTTFTEDPIDWWQVRDKPVLDPEILNLSGIHWWHKIMLLDAWYGCGAVATSGESQSLAYWPDPFDVSQPSTWPIRVLDPQPAVRSADQRALKQFLGSPAVENFYGFAHAGMNYFGGITGTDLEYYIGSKRFRFAFLDGCDSGLGANHLIRRFGAAGLELGRGRTIDQLRATQPDGPLQGPVLIGEYAAPTIASPNNLGLRPAAFLGWRYSPVIGPLYRPPQPEAGNWKGALDAAVAHWEQLVVFYWRELNYSLDDALEVAGHEAVDPGAWPPWEMNFPVIEWPDGSQELHYPNSGLLVFGYGELKFNQFNEAGETW